MGVRFGSLSWLRVARTWASFCGEDATKGHFKLPSYVWSGLRDNTSMDFYFGNAIYIAIDLSVGFQSRSRFNPPGLEIRLGSHVVVDSRSIKIFDSVDPQARVSWVHKLDRFRNHQSRSGKFHTVPSGSSTRKLIFPGCRNGAVAVLQ
jgi:hypothetical protein